MQLIRKMAKYKDKNATYLINGEILKGIIIDEITGTVKTKSNLLVSYFIQKNRFLLSKESQKVNLL